MPSSTAGRRPARAGSPSSSISAIPFGYGEQAPFLAARHLRDHALDGVRPRLGRRSRRRRAPERDAVRAARPRRGVASSPRSTAASSSSAGRRPRLPRQPHRPRLGDRARAADGARPVLRRHDRPLRALPAAAAPARRRLARAPAARSRLWLWLGALIGLGALAGVFPRGADIPPPPDSRRVTSSSAARPAASSALAALAVWPAPAPDASRTRPATRGRARGVHGRPLALVLVAAGIALVSPYALVFLLPSLYAWLWLPQVARGSGWVRDVALRRRPRRPGARARRPRDAARARARRPALRRLADDARVHPVDAALALIVWAAVATQLVGAVASGRLALPGQRPSKGQVDARRDRRRPARPRPRGTCTSASAAVARTIMCDSWPRDRLEQRAVAASHASRARTKSSRSGRARTRRRRACRAERRLRVGRALEREQRRTHEQQRSRRATRRGCRAARRRACSPRTPKASGFPGRIATPQKTSSTPSARSTRRTRSCGPTETPPEVTTTSASSARSSARSMRLLVVRDRRRARSTTAPAPASAAASMIAVRLVDLPRLERLPGRAQLGAGGEDDDARPPRARGRRAIPHAASAAEPGRRQQRARPGATTSPAGRRRPRGRMLSPERQPAAERSTRVVVARQPARSARPRRRPPARRRRSRCRSPRRRPSARLTGRPAATRATTRQRPGRVGGPHRVAVHRGARERRQVDRASARPPRGRVRPRVGELRPARRATASTRREHAASASSTVSRSVTASRYTGGRGTLAA